MSEKYLLVGLGNPGKAYEKTRHNVGFMVIDKLAEDFKAVLKSSKFKSMVAEAMIGNKAALLAKPLTFMNNSGMAIGPLVRFYDIPAEQILVIFDDVALPLGTIKLRSKGSSGGHNGLESIIEHLGTREISRIRIGIGRDKMPKDLSSYVLSRFNRAEQQELTRLISRASDASVVFIKSGIDQAMNEFNTSPAKA